VKNLINFFSRTKKKNFPDFPENLGRFFPSFFGKFRGNFGRISGISGSWGPLINTDFTMIKRANYPTKHSILGSFIGVYRRGPPGGKKGVFSGDFGDRFSRKKRAGVFFGVFLKLFFFRKNLRNDSSFLKTVIFSVFFFSEIPENHPADKNFIVVRSRRRFRKRPENRTPNIPVFPKKKKVKKGPFGTERKMRFSKITKNRQKTLFFDQKWGVFSGVFNSPPSFSCFFDFFAKNRLF